MVDVLSGATLGVTQVMQLLGIRAMCVFDVAGGVVTELYKHNCTVTRDSAGAFTATFASELPTADYLAFGASIYTLTRGEWSVIPSANPGYKSTTTLKFATAPANTASVSDPVQAWFVVFGG